MARAQAAFRLLPFDKLTVAHPGPGFESGGRRPGSFFICMRERETANGRYPLVRTSPRLASAAAAAARTRRRRSLARRLATRLAADVRCARPTVRSVACAALSAALRAPLRLHCLSLLMLVVVVLLLLVPMLLLARRGCATGLDARVASV